MDASHASSPPKPTTEHSPPAHEVCNQRDSTDSKARRIHEAHHRALAARPRRLRTEVRVRVRVRARVRVRVLPAHEVCDQRDSKERGIQRQEGFKPTRERSLAAQEVWGQRDPERERLPPDP